MIYELMHCDIVVAEVEINESGELKKLLSIVNADHFLMEPCRGIKPKILRG